MSEGQFRLRYSMCYVMGIEITSIPFKMHLSFICLGLRSMGMQKKAWQEVPIEVLVAIGLPGA